MLYARCSDEIAIHLILRLFKNAVVMFLNNLEKNTLILIILLV